MKGKITVIIVALLAVSLHGFADDNRIVDVTKNFNYCWGNTEQITNNADGSITYKTSVWGGLAWWVDSSWEEYERLVFELKAPTACAVQPLILYADGNEGNYMNAGIMEAYVDINPKLSHHVNQVALQTEKATTLTILRIYLVKAEVNMEDEPEEVQADEDGGKLVINELMQSNIDCIMDNLKDFPDSWVELYNAGTGTVNLGNYRIGITPDAAEAYQLPGKQVEPGQHRLVYCDKVGEIFHTPFRLESSKGCEVYLFKGNELIDQVAGLKKQPAPNIAYGRKTDGDSEWGYQLTPSPKEANNGGICDHNHILGEPQFSETGRVSASALSLRLTLSVPEGSPEGTEIRYTTDGTEPTSHSPLYVTPITINQNRTVTAKLFCKGWLSPRATTHSYLHHSRKVTLPVVSITTPDDYLNDSRIGIFANNTSDKHNDWRRPINIELFTADGEPSTINQLCETRVAGAASRGAQKKSMALYANKRFGTKRFTYEFFPDQKPGLTDFKSIVLRNAGNDFDYLYMRDAIVQRTMATHTDLDWQAWQPAIVYINGQYHGMLNIRERANENNVYTNYDGLEDVDLIENWWDLKEGDWENYNRFKAFYTEKGHTMAEYETWMDCGEFINLMAMNLYYNNYDFPGNNIIMWRPRTEEGRWRWIAKDADFTMGLYGDGYSFKILEWLYNPNYDPNHNWGANSYDATRLFRRLMDDADFKREFIDRCAIYMGDFMNERGTWSVWEPMYEQIKFEYPYHRKLINEWWPNYNDELTHGRNWIKQRTAQFYTQLSNYYKLGTPVQMTISQNSTDDSEAPIRFNGVRLSEGKFDGKFFANRVLTLEGDTESGSVVTSWTIRQTTGSSTTTTRVDGSTLTMLMPQCSNLAITADVGRDPSAVSTLTKPGTAKDVYDLRGRKVRTGTTSLDGLPRGIYIIGGKKVVK